MKNLRLLRKQANLTMKDLGTRLSLSESTVSLYETGKRSPDIQTLIRIADYFHVSVDYLIGYIDTKDGPHLSQQFNTTEEKLITDFRSLNKQGRDYILQSMAMAVTIYKNAFVSDMDSQAR